MMDNRLTQLRAPFPADRVSWRIGSKNKENTKGLALAYIDSRDVQDRLDDVMGAENWQNRFPHANGKTVCEIGLRLGGEWIWKSDGAGDTDVEAEKGALSDAFKRAAVKWGVGRYLYDVDPPWVEIEPMGKSYKIKEHEYRRLRRLLSGEPLSPEKKAEEAPPKQDGPAPVVVPKPQEWLPDTAKVFTNVFINRARQLSKEVRQEHYRLNEAAIKELRLVSPKAADNIDNLFAEIA
jgi:hypothetical protein